MSIKLTASLHHQ